jgi:hypothetical protein
MTPLEFDDRGMPMCETCQRHWLADRPRSGNLTAYFTRFHQMGHRA